MTASEIFSPKVFPLPWQTEQFPSPAESQSGPVWLAILHFPTISAILIWFHVTVKTRSTVSEKTAILMRALRVSPTLMPVALG
jgi:hypothetical protein